MGIQAKPWNREKLPRKILAIRLQAMGDVVITLPYLQYLRDTLPESTKIDFLTRKETDPIPRNLVLFNHVYSIAGKRNLKIQFVFTLLLIPRLLFRRYDVILDLQNNILSKLVRKVLRPKAWVEFDRNSLIPAGDRTRLTIEAAGLGKTKPRFQYSFKSNLPVKTILKNYGWDENNELVVLNPAGLFETRNWPLANYTAFACTWLKEYPATQFLVLGLDIMKPRAEILGRQLGRNLINLAGKTNAAEAFSILQFVRLVVSEDSGLLHMAWVSGIPTLALFGGSRGDKARPVGPHTDSLDSGDLDCGHCMLEKCKWGDNRCLTRYSAEFIFEKVRDLLQQQKRSTADPEQ